MLKVRHNRSKTVCKNNSRVHSVGRKSSTPLRAQSRRHVTTTTAAPRKKKRDLAKEDIEEVVPHHTLFRVIKPQLPTSNVMDDKRTVITANLGSDITTLANEVFFRGQKQQSSTINQITQENPATILHKIVNDRQLLLTSKQHTDELMSSNSNTTFNLMTFEDYKKRDQQSTPFVCEVLAARYGNDTNELLTNVLNDANITIDYIDNIQIFSSQNQEQQQQSEAQNIIINNILQQIHTLSKKVYHRKYIPINDDCGKPGNQIDLKQLPNQVFSRPLVSIIEPSNNNNNTTSTLMSQPQNVGLLSLSYNTPIPSTYKPHLTTRWKSQKDLPEYSNLQGEPQLVNIVYSDITSVKSPKHLKNTLEINNDDDNETNHNDKYKYLTLYETIRESTQYSWQDVSRKQRQFRILTQPAYNLNAKENRDFYFNEKNLFTLTQLSHIERGYCCENICKHCPYSYPEVLAADGITKLLPGQKEEDKGFLFLKDDTGKVLQKDIDTILLYHIGNEQTPSIAMIFARLQE